MRANPGRDVTARDTSVTSSIADIIGLEFCYDALFVI